MCHYQIRKTKNQCRRNCHCPPSRMLERSSFDDVMKQLDVVRIFDSDDGDDDDDECNLIDEYHYYLNNMNGLLNVKDVH